jgi:superfamily II DNA or RNA helicase
MRKPVVQIAFNATIAKIVGGDEEARGILANLTSYQVDGYQHMNAFQSGRWDGRKSFFAYSTDTFPAGFAEIAIEELRTKGYEVQRVCRPLPAPLGPERPVIDDFGYDPMYDYQPATVDRLVKRGAMIARVATGGGKSRICRMAHARIGRRTLFVTTRALLLHQMKGGFQDSGYKVGVIGDGEWSPIMFQDHCVNVGMVQTLAQRLAEPEMFDRSPAAERQRRVRAQTMEFLATVDLLVAEEAHEASGDSYFLVTRSCKNAYYRLALTATPFMKDGAEGNMRLMASFGQIGIDITEKMLIDRGVLAEPYFKFVAQTEKPAKLFKTTAWPRCYELGVQDNENRNADVVRYARMFAEYGLTGMVLVGRQKHGKELENLLRAAGLRTRFIWGATSHGKRDDALKALAAGDIDVLIGSTILDVGVDVPAVGYMILAGGGKAEVQHRQRIGRGLRRKKKGPNVAFVVDWLDELNKHLSGHAATRMSIIRETPGFAENLLKPNEDFDLPAMGFKKVRTIGAGGALVSA